ncbi:MAG: hypothetical protein EXQ56_14395 [Acidobacteria bacterium]|nr:hypothetical protein [Acidobacteriota bacterium]
MLLAESVSVDPATSAGAFSVSPAGVVAWRTGGGGLRQFVWFDRAGRSVGSLGPPESTALFNPEISPDGKHIGITRGPVRVSGDIWLFDGPRSTRFTFAPADDRSPVWSPDGKQVVFMSTRMGTPDLYLKPADAARNEEVLLHSPEAKRPNSWSPDGKYILYATEDVANGDLMLLPLTGDRKPYPFLRTAEASESQGAFSRDGRWVAYQSNATGRSEIFVRPFPGPGGQWQVSTDGGVSPRWRADGKELFFISRDSKLMAVAIEAHDATLQPGTPRELFQTRIMSAGSRPQYDVAPDGRFLINTEVEEADGQPIHLLLNWNPPEN